MAAALPGDGPGPTAESEPPAIRDAEWELIASTLARCNGNRTRAAQLLGISRRTIQRRIAEHEKPAD